jgi:hypothetical protein
MADKRAVARKLADAHYAYEPGNTKIFAIVARPECESLATEPIKLLEVNKLTIPSGIMPLGFDRDPTEGIPIPSVIVEVTPEELEKIKRSELRLPHDWTLGDLLPRPKPTRKGK